MELTPTLWRTCRVLSGATRLELLRRIIERPDQCVAEMTEAMGLSETRVSQELRRLQSRGLVQVARDGRWVRYRPVPDPKVLSAKPLLAAAKESLSKRPAEETLRVAKAFGHERRLKLVRLLQTGIRRADELQFLAGFSKPALFRHLRVLNDGGLVHRSGGGWTLAPNLHPLAKALKSLLADSNAGGAGHGVGRA